jgi:hypothetical protein
MPVDRERELDELYALLEAPDAFSARTGFTDAARTLGKDHDA